MNHIHVQVYSVNPTLQCHISDNPCQQNSVKRRYNYQYSLPITVYLQVQASEINSSSCFYKTKVFTRFRREQYSFIFYAFYLRNGYRTEITRSGVPFMSKVPTICNPRGARKVPRMAKLASSNGEKKQCKVIARRVEN